MTTATRKPRTRMFVDQYGHCHWARSVKDLREQVGGAVSKQYTDKADGSVVHSGYVIGSLWLTEVAPVERPT